MSLNVKKTTTMEITTHTKGHTVEDTLYLKIRKTSLQIFQVNKYIGFQIDEQYMNKDIKHMSLFIHSSQSLFTSNSNQIDYC